MSDANLSSSMAQNAPRGKRGPLRIRAVNVVAIVVAAALAIAAFVSLGHVFESEQLSEQASEAYRECSSAARNLQEASDYLTSQVRVYVVTGDRTYMDAYLDELLVADRRGKAVETLRNYLDNEDQAVEDLARALSISNELAERELYAMKLTCMATGLSDIPALVDEVTIEPQDLALPAAERRALAEQIVLGAEYQASKMDISGAVRSCSDSLLSELNVRVMENNEALRRHLRVMRLVVMALVSIVVLVIFAVALLVLWPLAVYTREVKNGEPLTPSGAAELYYMADAYNVIYAENRARTLSLRKAAERDHLTGLYNRGAYDQLLRTHSDDGALLLVDVDYFKEVNDTHGHDAGDAVLTKVARALEGAFRTTDYVCRIGGDEFAVIATGIAPSLRHVLVDRVGSVSAELASTSDGLPPVTLSVGIAFAQAHPGEDDLYKAADQALYVVKERGRDGYAFYDEVATEAPSA